MDRKMLESRVARLEQILNDKGKSLSAKIREEIIKQIGKANAKFLDVTQNKNSIIVNYYDGTHELVSSYMVEITPKGYKLTDIHELHRGFKPVTYSDLFELSLEIADNILSDSY